MAVAQDSLYFRLQSMSSTLEGRPASALARGVQITEFKETRVNPDPIVLEDSDMLMEQYLSPGKLRLLTGVQNLEDVRCLEIKVDTTDTSLGNFGSLLPNLTQLRLSNSVIHCIRDLGSSLRNITILWMSRCALQELDGISSMLSLQELYLSYNEICDISPLSMLDSLQVLDLEGNNLDDVQQIHYLAMCMKLASLTFEGNPICAAPHPETIDVEDYDYRLTVKKAIPHLKYLDDEPLTSQASPSKKVNVFDDDWAYIEELQKDVGIGGSVESLHSSGEGSSRPGSGGRPGTASLRPTTGYRPGSALRPSSGFRPFSASRRPATTSGANIRPSTADAPKEKAEAVVNDDATSDLTMGKVICGNPSKALMSRRKIEPGEQVKEATELKLFPQFQHKPEHTYDVVEEDRGRSEIEAELKAWRAEHEKRMEVIKAQRAPQVLVIDHDDAFSLSGDEEVTDEEDNDINENCESNNASQDEIRSRVSPQTHVTSQQDRKYPSSSEVYEKLNINRMHQGLKHDESFDAERDIHVNGPKKISVTKDIVTNPLKPYPPIKPLGRISPSGSRELPVPRAPPPSAVGVHPLRKTTAFPEPVIRQSTDKPLPPPTRPATARAVLMPTQPRIRRQLPNMPKDPILPSKPNFPK